MALTCSLTLIFHKSCIYCRILMHQVGYHTPTLGSIGGIGNLRSSRRKPFFFLNFDTFPRWIPQHHIKSSRPASLLILRYLTLCRYPEHIREGQVPVKELVLLSQAYNLVFHPIRDAVGVLLDVTKHLFSDRISELIVLFPYEGGAPGISPQPTKEIVAGLHQLVIVFLLALDLLYRVIAHLFQLHDACG